MLEGGVVLGPAAGYGQAQEGEFYVLAALVRHDVPPWRDDRLFHLTSLGEDDRCGVETMCLDAISSRYLNTTIAVVGNSLKS